MTETTESLKRQLADGAAQLSGTDRSNEAIRTAAVERINVIDDRLEELRPKTITDKAAADEYQALVLEIGTLRHVLG
jgi:hypothetical protein